MLVRGSGSGVSLSLRAHNVGALESTSLTLSDVSVARSSGIPIKRI